MNCRDLEGRHSTPLHFAAGYNRVTVVEFLLQNGADVHAKDKGYWQLNYFLNRPVVNLLLLLEICSVCNATLFFLFLSFRGLVPLHNACSYGHYEVAELLVKVRPNNPFVMTFSCFSLTNSCLEHSYLIAQLRCLHRVSRACAPMMRALVKSVLAVASSCKAANKSTI